MRRSTIVLLLLLLLLAGLYWSLQQPNNLIQRTLSGNATATPPGPVYLIDQANNLVYISLLQEGGRSLMLDQSSGSWQFLPAEGETLPEGGLAETVASDLKALRILARLDPPPDPVSTGLDSPLYHVSVGLADGSTLTFQIGQKTVTQSGYYIKLEDGSVIVANLNSLSSVILLLQTVNSNPTPTP